MRLFFLISTLAATALAGIGVTAVLAAGSRLPLPHQVVRS